MQIENSMYYVDRSAVDRGLAHACPYGIIFDVYYSEEERAAGVAYAESHNEEEWNAYCEKRNEKIAAENLALMEYLEKYFVLGQFRKPYDTRDKDRDNYVFWFWCNDRDPYGVTNGRLSGRDYSYITLTFNNNINEKERENIFEQIKEILKNYPAGNTRAVFNYEQVENTDFVKNEAERIYEKCKEKYIGYNGSIGKIKRFGDKYYFIKKYAKRYGYELSPYKVCMEIKF